MRARRNFGDLCASGRFIAGLGWVSACILARDEKKITARLGPRPRRWREAHGVAEILRGRISVTALLARR